MGAAPVGDGVGLSCDAPATEASLGPTWGSGPGMAFQRCPKWWGGAALVLLY